MQIYCHLGVLPRILTTPLFVFKWQLLLLIALKGSKIEVFMVSSYCTSGVSESHVQSGTCGWLGAGHAEACGSVSAGLGWTFRRPTSKVISEISVARSLFLRRLFTEFYCFLMLFERNIEIQGNNIPGKWNIALHYSCRSIYGSLSHQLNCGSFV